MTPKETALAFIERFCSSSGHLVLEQSFEIYDGRIRAVRLELCSG
jgi:hypothetical protein